MDTDSNYINDRITEQETWHSRKAGWNKKCFYAVEITTLFSGALIPIVNLVDFINEPWRKLISALLATIIVIAAGLGKLYKYQENWLSYRALAEILKREKALYLNRVGEYNASDDQERHRMLVGRVEDVLASANSQFVALHRAERNNPPAESAAGRR
jgi:hypothetical protein